MKRSIFDLVHVKGLAASGLLVLIAGGTAFSQQSLDSNYRMTGPGVLQVFEPQRQVIQQCSAVIYDGRKVIAQGTVISADGYILSKASELEGKASHDVRVDRELFKNVKVVLVDPVWDVALLKLEAKGLVPIEYSENADPAQGSWVVANGATSRTKRRVLVGVISANSREILPEDGVSLGLSLKEEKEQLEIEELAKGGGAEEAGLEKGDIIIAVDGKAVKSVKEIRELLEDKKAGSKIAVTVSREGEKLELEVKLSTYGELYREVSRQDQMSGDFSTRRSGFPKVVQHDMQGNRTTMGGPLIGLDGKVVGMNIARANRTESFAIPADELKKLAEGMMAVARKEE